MHHIRLFAHQMGFSLLFCIPDPLGAKWSVFQSAFPVMACVSNILPNVQSKGGKHCKAPLFFEFLCLQVLNKQNWNFMNSIDFLILQTTFAKAFKVWAECQLFGPVPASASPKNGLSVHPWQVAVCIQLEVQSNNANHFQLSLKVWLLFALSNISHADKHLVCPKPFQCSSPVWAPWCGHIVICACSHGNFDLLLEQGFLKLLNPSQIGILWGPLKLFAEWISVRPFVWWWWWTNTFSTALFIAAHFASMKGVSHSSTGSGSVVAAGDNLGFDHFSFFCLCVFCSQNRCHSPHLSVPPNMPALWAWRATLTVLLADWGGWLGWNPISTCPLRLPNPPREREWVLCEVVGMKFSVAKSARRAPFPAHHSKWMNAREQHCVKKSSRGGLIDQLPK